MKPYTTLRHLLLSLFLIVALSFSGYSQLAVAIENNTDKDILSDRNEWIELKEKREINSSTYKTPDNRTIIHYSKQPLNYFNEVGNLVPVKLQFKQKHMGYVCSAQPTKISVLHNGSVEFISSDNQTMRYSRSKYINGNSVQFSQLKEVDGQLIASSNIPGLEKSFKLGFNSLKYNYVLNQLIPTTTANLIIEEDLFLPEGAKVVKDPNLGKSERMGWMGPLLIKSKDDKELGSLAGIVCYDANNKHTLAAYRIKEVNGNYSIQLVIPTTWLNEPSRAYPVTIDPLVTGPTATYAGPLIPSCISPNTGSDSILVTIPAQVTVTAFNVSGSFYADPFSTAIMNDGLMYFSTNCGTSGNYTTTGATGSLPGTAYLTNGDLKNPLLCCVAQACTSQTIYLSMHVGRTVGGSGCNTSYIYHNPFSSYPFSAYVEGYTPEGFGPGFNVTPTTICSNECTLNGSTFLRYGVPPYTISHPWMANNMVVGSPSGCSTGSTITNFNLSIPNCPWTCDTFTTLTVPAPTVTDACMNTVAGLQTKTVNVTQVPDANASPNAITMCSGDTFNTTLSSCIPSSTINWTGNSSNGAGASISQSIENLGSTVSTTNYSIVATNNGCVSDTATFTVNTVPLPQAGINADPSPAIINSTINFSDASQVVGGGSNNWFWTFGDGTTSNAQNPTHTYTEPGIYTVCLFMETIEGCQDSICQDIEIIPAELVFPNVVTPNGDNSNDVLYFEHLEFFGSNNLKVFNRWGQLMFEQDNYANDWSPKDLIDGTYYYLLTLENGEVHESFLEVLK